MSESRIKPVAGKPILTQSDMDNGLTEDVILLGIDLGTSRSSVVALNGVRKTIDSYVGYPKDAVSRKMLKTDVLYGKAAIDNQLALNLYRPLEKGVIKGTYEGEGASSDEGNKNLTAAQDLIRHLVDLVGPGRDQLIYGVVGVPAQATGKNKTAIIEITKDIFDSVMIVSEPFTVAYGMERMSDILVIDIGAGTTDLCRMHGTVPGPDDEISFTIAGDAVDAKLFELIKMQVPQLTAHPEHVQGFQGTVWLRQRHQGQGRSADARERQAHPARHHRCDETGLRNPGWPDLRCLPQADQQLQPRIPGPPAKQHPARRRRRYDARPERPRRTGPV